MRQALRPDEPALAAMQPRLRNSPHIKSAGIALDAPCDQPILLCMNREFVQWPRYTLGASGIAPAGYCLGTKPPGSVEIRIPLKVLTDSVGYRMHDPRVFEGKGGCRERSPLQGDLVPRAESVAGTCHRLGPRH